METVASESGSSPQVRGKPEFDKGDTTHVRLIPAGAGKTSKKLPHQTCTTAHPRRCGENQQSVINLDSFTGSSPQVRGKPARITPAKKLARLIPAGAGKTSSMVNIYTSLSAHPRRCGENFTTDAWNNIVSGSSPQVRGKLVISSPFSMRVRLIPAGAGKTS